MTNIGESLTTRLARERQQAIENFLPVRDSVREKLQAQQQARVEFATGTEELFRPVTTATEKAAAVTERALLGEADAEERKKGILPVLKQTAEQTEKIATRTKQAKKILRGLPAEIAVAEKKKPVTREIVELIEKFNEVAVKELKGVTDERLPLLVLLNLNRKEKILMEKYLGTSDENFIKWMYRIHYNKKYVKYDDSRFKKLTNDIHELDEENRSQLQQPQPSYSPQEQESYRLPPPLQQIERQRLSPILETFEESYDDPKTGSGLGSGFIACPDNIINDVSRLEVLIGGKRAGNNSREIINEAADICQRLFQRGIMDAGIYRELIDELVDSD